MDEEYYKRIEAIQFTMAHDDGKTINDIDIICLQMLGLQVNGVNYIEQLQLVGV